MYDELIKNLRIGAKCFPGYKLYGYSKEPFRLMPEHLTQAADAIEELQDAIEELQTVVDGLTAQTSMVFEKTEGRTVIKFEPKWIPVTERLPEENGSYLIVNVETVTKIVTEAYYNKDWGDSCWTDPVELYMTYHPTHWMPLPQPPESEE